VQRGKIATIDFAVWARKPYGPPTRAEYPATLIA